MKIEVRKFEDESPFRHECWAVLRDGRVAAYCMTPGVAESLWVILSLEVGQEAILRKRYFY